MHQVQSGHHQVHYHQNRWVWPKQSIREQACLNYSCKRCTKLAWHAIIDKPETLSRYKAQSFYSGNRPHLVGSPPGPPLSKQESDSNAIQPKDRHGMPKLKNLKSFQDLKHKALGPVWVFQQEYRAGIGPVGQPSLQSAKACPSHCPNSSL